MKYSNLIISALLGWLGMSAATAHPLYIYSSTNGVIALDTENIVSIDYVDMGDKTKRMGTEGREWGVLI